MSDENIIASVRITHTRFGVLKMAHFNSNSIQYSSRLRFVVDPTVKTIAPYNF